jgi:hypothetical protein
MGKLFYSGSNVKDSISNLSLFALNGQDDIEGLENYDIFCFVQ